MVDPKLDKPGDWDAYLKANDEKHLRSIYASNFPKIRNYVLENSGTEEDAKDVYHEAFLAVWRNIQLERVSFDTVDNFQGYLFRVAQYNWIDQLRSRKKMKVDSIDISEMNEIQELKLDNEDEEYLKKVKDGYSTMGEPCREVLHRFYYLKQRLREIAERFGWTEATAKNNKYRCLEKLRRIILNK